MMLKRLSSRVQRLAVYDKIRFKCCSALLKEEPTRKTLSEDIDYSLKDLVYYNEDALKESMDKVEQYDQKHFKDGWQSRNYQTHVGKFKKSIRFGP